ncbi:damage-control phosphatase ARMT1 family protein [Streptomyces sp. V4-01]|uniref:Damage-control phosphatase ARMT1 family protein n=1 Tax=Actinacidiphila polyblastidii TaxID=3110430 RepID=A0ABU7PFT0_9ACTN|nr:damage-control phosphatase ARMT1 family protein [Streptomyces sp. V4-01]
MITSADPDSFPHSVLAERHPALIRQVRDAFPYPPDRQQALDALAAETAWSAAGTAAGRIAPLPAGAHDEARWGRWGRPYVGQSWFEVPFLWAESYFYRRLLEAVGHFGPGPWQGVDPFAPFKRAELRGAAVAEELAALDEVPGLPREEQDRAVLGGALWGNRADLGFRISAGGGTDTGAGTGGEGGGGRGAGEDARDGVIVDDADRFWRHLGPAGPASTPSGATALHLVADNAGRELIPDLILLDHLLTTGRAATAVLHVKPYPYFVSDATTADVVDCLRRITEAPGRAGRIGARLWDAMTSGRLAVRDHWFFCAPLPYAAMPDDLRADLAQAAVTVFKGDLNYRRLVGDRHHPATTPFASLTSYAPSPLLALRTLKSDVAVGLDPDVLADLERDGGAWRTGGTHAVVQFRA